MSGTAQGWLILRLTDSSTSLGLQAFVSMMPTLLLTLYAGVLADRVDRRRLLIATQIALAVLSATLAFLATTGVIQFWHILVISLVSGCAGALQLPAFQALLPMLVDRKAIGNAIALNSAQFNFGRVLGPAIAGLVVASVGEASTFWFNAVALAVLAWLLRGLRLPAQEVLTRQEAGLWSNLLDGFRYIQTRRVLVALLALGAAPALFILPYGTLMPLFARDVLGIGAAGLGLLNASVGVGALGAAVLFALRPAEGGNGRVLIVGLVWMAFTLAVFGLTTQLSLSLIALVALGASQIAYYTTTNMMVLLLSPARLRGRILSVQTLGALGLMPLGSLAMGALADRIGPHVTLLAGAGLTVVALALIVAWCPQLWTLRLDPALPPPGGEPASPPEGEPSPSPAGERSAPSDGGPPARPSVKPSGSELPQEG